MSIVLLDAPSISGYAKKVKTRFAFTDIIWGYSDNIGAYSDDLPPIYVFGSYDVDVEFKGVITRKIKADGWYFRNIFTRVILYLKFCYSIINVKPDIIHTVDYFGLAIISIFTKANLVLTTPGCIYERIETKQIESKLEIMTLLWAFNFLKNKNVSILASSEYIASYWIDHGFEKSRVKVLPLPSAIKIDNLSSEGAKEKLKWPIEEINLLLVSELRRENDIDVGLQFCKKLIDCLKTQCDNKRTILIHIVGDGPIKGDLLDTVKLLEIEEYVTFHGKIDYDSLKYYYMASDYLIMPRRHNATPRVVQEALLCGTKVIANMNKSLESLEKIFNNSILRLNFSQDDYECEDLIRILYHNREDLESSRFKISQLAQSVLSAEEITKDVVKLYKQLLDNDGITYGSTGVER